VLYTIPYLVKAICTYVVFKQKLYNIALPIYTHLRACSIGSYYIILTVVKTEQISIPSPICIMYILHSFNIIYKYKMRVFYTIYLILTRALITRRIKVKLTHDTSQPFREQDEGHLLSNTSPTHPLYTILTHRSVPRGERFRQTINRLGNTTFSRRPLGLSFIHSWFVRFVVSPYDYNILFIRV